MIKGIFLILVATINVHNLESEHRRGEGGGQDREQLSHW